MIARRCAAPRAGAQAASAFSRCFVAPAPRARASAGYAPPRCLGAPAILIVVAVALAGPAHAGDPPAPGLDAPARADDPAAQREARELFAAGNQRFEDNDFVGAAELYRAALARWDRPVIRFNLAVALIELDRSREAFAHLERALGPGADELGPRAAEARNYLRLLRARLSTLTIHFDAATTCELDGEAVAAAGQPLVLEAGSHTLIARKPGFEPWTRVLVLEPGAARGLNIVLDRPRTRLVRRWSSAQPWIVTGAGAALALVGGAVLALGNSDMDTANAELRARCVTPCPGVPVDLARQVDAARFEQRLGAVGIAAGGAVVLTGLVLVYLNQPRAVPALEAPPVGVAVTPRGVMISVGGAL